MEEMEKIMTYQEIIEIIAEKFMRWHKQGDKEYPYYWVQKVPPATFVVMDGHSGSFSRSFNPLTDPAACALVLDEIERRGWDWMWDCNKRFDDMPYGFSVVVEAQVIGEWADSRYRAVCLAALLALGVEA